MADEQPRTAGLVAECARLGTSEAAIEKAEKKGFFTGFYAQHPLIKDKKLPVYIANFVLMDYGTGAIFGCPAHDQRDLDFARAYDLTVLPVVQPAGSDDEPVITDTAYSGPGRLINSGPWTGLDIESGKSAALSALEEAGAGDRKITFRLRDWVYHVSVIGAAHSDYSLFILRTGAGSRRSIACNIA